MRSPSPVPSTTSSDSSILTASINADDVVMGEDDRLLTQSFVSPLFQQGLTQSDVGSQEDIFKITPGQGGVLPPRDDDSEMTDTTSKDVVLLGQKRIIPGDMSSTGLIGINKSSQPSPVAVPTLGGVGHIAKETGGTSATGQGKRISKQTQFFGFSNLNNIFNAGLNL